MLMSRHSGSKTRPRSLTVAGAAQALPPGQVDIPDALRVLKTLKLSARRSFLDVRPDWQAHLLPV
jgi:hypothetical protein